MGTAARVARYTGIMHVYHGIERYAPPATGITLTIGNFDGVHRGHRSIIDLARGTAAGLGTPVVVMTFEPHPLAIVAPERAPARLVTLNEKVHLLDATGVDVCIVVRSEPALLSQSADEFLEELARHCRPRAIVEGPDFNFGRGRTGSADTLRVWADRLGFSAHVAATTKCTELPGAPAVRSSAIRAALQAGQVDVATAMLGRPYRIVGTVGSGAGRGAELGFPTANLDDVPHLLPQPGVYAAVAQLADGELRLAAVNVGPQPTFGQDAPRVEAHLLEWSQPLRGQRLGLHLLARLRGQTRFREAADLAVQLGRDVAAAREHAALLLALQRSRPLPL